MEQPRPHRSHSFLPQWRRGQDCYFGDKNSICNNNVPTVWTIPTLNPLPDQEASSSTNFHRERYSLEPAAPTPGHPAASGMCLGEAEAIRPGPLPRMSCPGTILSSSLPSLSSLPSPGSPSDPREPWSQERSEEAQGLLAGTKERSPGLRSH